MPHAPHVVVPSYRRPGCLVKKTLPLLLSRGVAPANVTVVVADRAEAADYAKAMHDALGGTAAAIRLEVAVPGMAAVRNWIADTFRGPVVQIDDDVSDVMRWRDPKHLDPVEHLPALFEEGFDLAAQAGAGLWGIYPVPNPYFMRPRVRTDLTYIEGGFWGAVLTGAPHQRVTLDDKEDYERSLRYYLADGSVVRIEWWTFRANYYTEPGGMQEERTPERVDASARELVRRYPELASVNTSKKSRSFTEVRLRDRRKRVPA